MIGPDDRLIHADELAFMGSDARDRAPEGASGEAIAQRDVQSTDAAYIMLVNLNRYEAPYSCNIRLSSRPPHESTRSGEGLQSHR